MVMVRCMETLFHLGIPLPGNDFIIIFIHYSLGIFVVISTITTLVVFFGLMGEETEVYTLALGAGLGGDGA